MNYDHRGYRGGNRVHDAWRFASQDDVAFTEAKVVTKAGARLKD